MLLNTKEKIAELNNQIAELNNKITQLNKYSDTYYNHTLIFKNFIPDDADLLSDASLNNLKSNIKNFNFKPTSWCGYKLLIRLGYKPDEPGDFDYEIVGFAMKFNDTEEEDPITAALAYVLNSILTKICKNNDLKTPSEYYPWESTEYKHEDMYTTHVSVDLHKYNDNYIRNVIEPCYYAWRITNLCGGML